MAKLQLQRKLIPVEFEVVCKIFCPDGDAKYEKFTLPSLLTHIAEDGTARKQHPQSCAQGLFTSGAQRTSSKNQ
eukprot:1839649-Amphidinium_carterae.1